ncbi:polycystic kidney disease protein 1-like 2 [Gigantopelta aegis]|uniref:polycystic kidney disease protein 1-like 2 n=1 Tax=Gigantopelta aegis TaxID=1735272 RepID=UPI001B88A6FC|nr:polycystic kidney disease protein 1-like 2 [Gigantopelta aegis]
MFTLMSKIKKKTLYQEGFGLSLEEETVQNITNSSRPPLNGANFKLDGLKNKSIGNKDLVKLQLRVVKGNIYSGGDNAKLVNSPVVIARVQTEDGSLVEISKPVVKQTDLVTSPYKLITPQFIKEDAAKLLYHRLFYRNRLLNICLSILPIANIKLVYDMFLRTGNPPTDITYDHYTSYKAKEGETGINYCIPAGTLKRMGVVYLGLRPRLNEADPVSRPKRSVDVQTSSGSSTRTSNESSVLETPYMFRVNTIGCFSWDAQIEDWNSNTCEFSRDELNNETTCVCPDTKDLVASVSFFVAPNMIDFSTVFSKFDVAGQAAVLSTLIVIFTLFVIAALFSRYKDGQDILQWGVSLLEDNFHEDTYFYLITVYTGMIRQGGTRSRIEFNISGEKGDTGIRALTDGVRKEFGSGSVLHFIIAVPHSLGRLQCLEIWHDNSGKGNWASWYLNRIEIVDLQTKERNDFLCYKWLSLETGRIETAIGAGCAESMKTFKRMFFEHARHSMIDDHLWLSTVLRPVKSHFSRVQRVGCCLALILLSMISNAMFFQGKEFKDRKQSVDLELGPIKFNFSQLWISFVSAIITTIPVFVIMLLFRKSKLSKRQVDANEYTTHWMLPCFKRFKFYKDSVALQKVLVIKDIVDDEDGVLPHFCVYIGWVLVALASLASAFFIFMYSAQWGKDISEEWLATFFLSFFESMFILYPFKILILSIIFAIILKNIKVVQPTIFDLDHIKAMNAKNGKPTETRRRLDYKHPFSRSQIKAAITKCKQKSKIQKAISEFLVTVFLLVLLCTICYSNRDPHSFLLRTNLENQLISPTKPLIKLSQVHSVRHYYHWLNYTVMDAMFPEENYNKEVLGSQDRLLMSDLNNFRIGAPRLRLVRQRKTSCSLPYVGIVKCIPRYSLTTADTRDYCEGWNSTKPCDEDEGLKLSSAAWSFVPAWKIWGIPITGSFNVYGGGGYIAELDISRPVAKKSIAELIETRWIDRQTRAVFLEFTVYSTNLNMFAYISLLSEFPETGSLLHYKNIFTFRSLQLTGTLGTFTIFCEILFLITTVIWAVVIGLRFLKERWTFFNQFWNIAELGTVGLSFCAIALYFYRLRFTTEALTKFRENTRKFVNFYHIAVWDSIFIYVVAIILAIVTVRLIKVMAYSKFTHTVFIVLKQSSKTLPGFFFYIILTLLVFAVFGTLFFGAYAKEYKDIITCLESLFSGVLGHTGFTKMNIPAESNWFGFIYFVTFIIIVTFTLANIFMSILLDTMDLLQSDKNGELDLELTTFLWHSAKEIITRRQNDKTLKPKTKSRRLTTKTFSKPEVQP